jgi:large subunit ribosomal protein L17
MRHRKSGRKLGRNSSHRKAMYRNMVTSLLVHGRIKTTEAKAKELRRIADRVITMGKHVPTSSLEGLDGDALKASQARRLHYIRRARRWVNNPSALERVFGEYADRFQARPGGYTRILKIGFRPGDNAPMVIIEFVGDYDPSAAKDRSEFKAKTKAELSADTVPAAEPEAPAAEEEVVDLAAEEPAAEEEAVEAAAEAPAAEEPAAEEEAVEAAAEAPAAEAPAAEAPAAEAPAAEEAVEAAADAGKEGEPAEEAVEAAAGEE